MKTIFPFIFLAFTFSCFKKQNTSKVQSNLENSEINSIEISTFGGELGFSYKFKITKDSLFFFTYTAANPSNKRDEKILNDKYKLEDIFNSNQIDHFSKIPNGKSRQPVDGTDTKINIEYQHKNYEVTNAEEHKIWLDLAEKLEEISAKEFGLN